MSGVRIEGNSTRVGAGSNTERAAGQRVEDGQDTSQSERAKDGVAATDRALLTPRAQEVRTALRTLAQLPEVRDDRVAEVRQQIAAGTFKVDPEAIADKLIAGGL